jgi:hypothetical protein
MDKVELRILVSRQILLGRGYIDPAIVFLFVQLSLPLRPTFVV